MNKIILLTLISIQNFSVALGCWSSPPEFIVLETVGGEFFIRKVNSKKTAEIRRSNDLGLSWETVIDEYDELFSILRLSPNGEYLIHIKGNHMVNSLSQPFVEVYSKQGKVNSYKGSDFLESLDTYPIEVSTDPRYKWLFEISTVSNSEINLRIGEYKHLTLGFKSHRIESYTEKFLYRLSLNGEKKYIYTTQWKMKTFASKKPLPPIKNKIRFKKLTDEECMEETISQIYLIDENLNITAPIKKSYSEIILYGVEVKN